MVNKGSAQLVGTSEIEEIITEINQEFKLNLIQLENLNEAFINKAKNLREEDFSGEFRDAFMDEMDGERRLIQNLNTHNLDSLRLFANRYYQFLSEMSSQSYVYETELVPVNPK